MSRIRNIKDLVFYKADRGDQYEHIGSLFLGTIDWALIERHLKDMLRVVISIKAGKNCAVNYFATLGNGQS